MRLDGRLLAVGVFVAVIVAGVMVNENQREDTSSLDSAVAERRQALRQIPEVERLGLRMRTPGATVWDNGASVEATLEQRIEIVRQSTPRLKESLGTLTWQPWYVRASDDDKRGMIDLICGKVQAAAQASVLDGEPSWTAEDAILLVEALRQKQEYDAIPVYRNLDGEQAVRTRVTTGVADIYSQDHPEMTREDVLAGLAEFDPEGVRLARMAQPNLARKRWYEDAQHAIYRQYFGIDSCDVWEWTDPEAW